MKAVLVAAVLAYSVTIPATVKTSLCGDGIVEGPEECEGGANCSSACEWLIKPSPSLEPSPSPVVASPAASSPEPAASAAPTVVELVKKILSPLIPELPAVIKVFDQNGDGKINFEELKVSLEVWVENWQEDLAERFNSPGERLALDRCDINKDKTCDLTDLSVMLYFSSN